MIDRLERNLKLQAYLKAEIARSRGLIQESRLLLERTASFSMRPNRMPASSEHAAAAAKWDANLSARVDRVIRRKLDR